MPSIKSRQKPGDADQLREEMKMAMSVLSARENGFQGHYFTMIKVTTKWWVKGKQPIPFSDFDYPQ